MLQCTGIRKNGFLLNGYVKNREWGMELICNLNEQAILMGEEDKNYNGAFG